MRTSAKRSYFPARRCLAASVALACSQAFAVTYTVQNTNDSGANSLRQAILDANANCSADIAPTINFSFTGTGPFTIQPATALPAFSCTPSYLPTVDATSQPLGQIIVDGSLATASGPANGLQSTGGSRLTVNGIQVSNFNYGGFAGAGIAGNVVVTNSQLTGNYQGVFPGFASTVSGNRIGNNVEGVHVDPSATSVTIFNNRIGTLDGSTAAPNGTGVFLSVNGPTVSISGNVISGNTGDGIKTTGPNVSITSNRIGTDATGNAALGNGAFGIEYRGGVSITISGNTISGNANGMIAANGDNTLRISGNRFGTNLAGTAAIGNTGYGLRLDCSNGPLLQSNVISGNRGNGLEIGAVITANNNNLIGVASDGTTALGNGGFGVLIAAGSCATAGVWIDNNTIAYNSAVGVEIGTGNTHTISRNRIYGHSAANIDIAFNYPYGGLPNDPGDGDAGVNNQQNYPDNVVLTVAPGNTSTTVAFTLDTAVTGSYTVDVFENPGAGIGAGRTYLGSTTVLGNGTGAPVTGSFTLSGAHNFISLTATSPLAETSEFSPIAAVAGTPAVAIAPTSLDFGSVATGTFSAVQTVNITSSGSADYVINTFDTASLCYGSAFACTGAFLCSTNCVPGQPYPNGSGCTVDFQFAPVFAGTDSGTLYICDNASGSPRSIAYTALGISAPPPLPLTISPTSHDFGPVLLGTKTAPRNFILFNPGGVPVDIGVPATTTPDFLVVSSDCTSSLAPSARCNIGVDFAPQGTGLRSDQLVVPGLILGSAAKAVVLSAPPVATASLSGTGLVQAQVAMPSTIDFGALTLGGAPAAITVPIMNTGNGVLTISSVSVTAPFTLANNCPLNLAPGASCTLLLGFDPATLGVATGTLTLVTNAPGGSGNFPVNALVQAVAEPVLRVTPTSLGFGSRMVGTGSPSQRVTITNIGGAQATLSPPAITLEYQVSTTCGATLAPGASCDADVDFRPLGFGPRPGSLTVTGNDAGSPHAVGLTGTGCRPFMVGRGVGDNCAP